MTVNVHEIVKRRHPVSEYLTSQSLLLELLIELADYKDGNMNSRRGMTTTR